MKEYLTPSLVASCVTQRTQKADTGSQLDRLASGGQFPLQVPHQEAGTAFRRYRSCGLMRGSMALRTDIRAMIRGAVAPSGAALVLGKLLIRP